ncbi:DUF4238 domain-containing protein [Celeribacter sp. SCSIO 80788]|uniref:DUF4238 domain-containing protein n=1 Tax=Celeribacter sp. SCSIO 80788 TaxID=3117013 RepID=UPI003DA291C0
MSQPRKHHILPQAYQWQFSTNQKHIWTWDKERDTFFGSNPLNISVQRDFNTALTHDFKEDFSTIEGFFSNFETSYPHDIKSLRNVITNRQALDHVIQFMLLQAARSPMARTMMSRFIEMLAPMDEEQLKQQGVDPIGIELIKRARSGDIDAKQKIGLQSSGHFLQGVTKIIERLFFRVVHLENELEFCSGDNPVAYFGIKFVSGKLTATFPLSGNRVLSAFPLSNKLLLIGDSAPAPSEAFLTVKPAQTSNSVNLVKYINRLLALSAERNVIASNEKILRHIRDNIPANSEKVAKLVAMQSAVAKELLKLNRSYWL